MNLLQTLSGTLTKERVTEIVQWIDADQKRFDELFDHFLNGASMVVQRAAWPLSYCIIRHPALIKKQYRTMLLELKKTHKPPSVKRNILRLLDQVPEIPKAHHGFIMNECFSYLLNPNEAIATQAFSIGILEKLSKQYPEIKEELAQAIELLLPNSTPGVRSRGLKFLKHYKKSTHKRGFVE